MEIPGGENFKFQICIRELIGTAFLVFAVAASGGNPEAIAGTLFCNIMILAGPLNGGHFNPAVTLAVLVREGMAKFGSNIFLAFSMIVSQIIGGGLGATLARATRSADNITGLYPAIARLCVAQPLDNNMPS